MNYRFQNLLGAPYRGGNVVVSNNTHLISATGSRISVTNLIKSETTTFPFQSSSDISRLAVSPDGVFLVTIDDNSRCHFINVARMVVLHRITFKKPVSCLRFSPDGRYIGVGVGKLVQIWRSPGFSKSVFPFELVKTFANCNDKVTCIDWNYDCDGNCYYLLVGSKDLTVRLLSFNEKTRYKNQDDKDSGKGNKPFMFLGHRDVIVGAFFGVEQASKKVNKVYTLSRDGAIFGWEYKGGVTKGGEPESPGTPERDMEVDDVGVGSGNVRKRKSVEGVGGMEKGSWLDKGKWELVKKDYFMQAPAKLTTCDYHKGLEMVVVGFSSGVFGLYQMPDFVCIHLLSISREKITTASFNDLGNWLTFGCAKLGQLLVWEWRSESYILKQQGHYFDVNTIAYSPDSQLLATGADDNKIKVWTVSSGFCFVTFSEHTNAVTALHFMASNHCLLSASLDGTVRAWDLFRYRNFRTFTTPSSRQFVSLAADQSGEVICAGTLDSFEIFVWSMKTGRLLDVLSGHEGPVHGLMFSPTTAILASSSWDKTIRLWDVFDGKGSVETFPHTHDVLTVVYRPDGKQLASSTLDGQIHFWDPIDGLLMYTIEGRRDIAGGRLMTDRRTAANSSSGKCFTTLSYSADGNYILAGGSSKYICMYDVVDQVLLRRFQITLNLSLDGVLDVLNSKNMTDAGALNLIDDYDSDIDDGVDKQTRVKSSYDLPGAVANRGRPIVRTKCIRIAPTGRSWSAATTEGVLVYSMDDNFIFDPTDLDIDVTPEFALVDVTSPGEDIVVDASADIQENIVNDGKDQKDVRGKKRAASDADSETAEVNLDIDHGDAMDGVQIDDDIDAPTMGEKLASLSIINNEHGSDEKAEMSPAKPPSADSVHVLLKQALHAEDRALLLDCLSRQNDKVITNSVALLNPSDVFKLLESLISVIQSRGSVVAFALPWLRSLLLQHASSIISQESSLIALNSLYQLIESRISTFNSALQLSSCLDLLYTKTVDGVDEEGPLEPIIYEDEESEEDGDAMETDEEDNEELEAVSNVSDLEGSDGMVDY